MHTYMTFGQWLPWAGADSALADLLWQRVLALMPWLPIGGTGILLLTRWLRRCAHPGRPTPPTAGATATRTAWRRICSRLRRHDR